MTNQPGPWGSEPPPRRRAVARRLPRTRWLILAGCAALTVAGVAALAWYFPGRLSTPDDWGYLLRGLGVLALVASGVTVAGRFGARHMIRSAAIWIAVLGAVLLAATYSNELKTMALRVRGALIPAYAVSTGAHSLALNQDAQGSYHVIGLVNGTPVDFLVDTGASDVVLSPADAHRLGLDLASLKFDHAYETANGIGEGAAFTAQSLNVGDIHMQNVPVSINKAEMSSSLLGMSFLRRLDSFEFRNGQLILKW